MKILIILGCVICALSIWKSVRGIIEDAKTNKARKKLQKVINGEKENDENEKTV